MRPVITVSTVPNGYSLFVDNHSQKKDYLYFSVHDLLDGILYHVGMEEAGAINMDMMKVLLETATKWRDNKALVKELMNKKEEIQALNDKLDAQYRKIDRLERSANRLKRCLDKSKKTKDNEKGKENEDP